MQQQIKPGMVLKKDFNVTRDDTARKIGSGGLEVLATPVLVTWIENSAYDLAQLCLDDEQTTVGVHVDINHMAATPVGMKVRIKIFLEKVDGRKLDFKVEAWDTVQKISEGRHQRFIVNKTQFMQKVLQKREKDGQ